MTTQQSYEMIQTDMREGAIGFITLNRPQALNALCKQLIEELEDVLDQWEVDPAIKVVIITGSERAFAAGADIKEMLPKSYMDVYLNDFIASDWHRLSTFRKPVIAAVSGYAIGGGCEIAMMCDIIIASDTAKFSLPEVTLGTMPGAGGTQRMPRAVGKSKAMDMCLTGRFMEAAEAERSGLISRVVPVATLEEEVMIMARKIASMSLPVLMMIKESINRAYETTLHEGMQFERRAFHTTFALDDRQEGMEAFVNKRKPTFKDC